MTDFFNNDATAILDSLFLRIDDLSVSAKAEAIGLDFDLFPGVGDSGIILDDGKFHISAGLGLTAPYELTLSDAGALTNGLDLDSTLTSRLAIEPRGKVVANLPFSVTIGSFTQNLVILIHDDNLFDEQDVLVKVDFNACTLIDLLQQLLGKLGSFQLSADSIFGNGALESLPLDLSETIGTFDEYFPNSGQFFDGILEGK